MTDEKKEGLTEAEKIQLSGVALETVSGLAAMGLEGSIAGLNAKIAKNTGYEAFRRSRIKSGRKVGEIINEVAMGGAFTGSNLDVIGQSAREAVYDASAAKHEYDMHALEFEQRERMADIGGVQTLARGLGSAAMIGKK